jgi:serine/threonine-protein kinase
VREGEVPDVRGQDVEEAAQTLADAGYTLAAIRTEAGPEEAGTATGTEPEMGTAAEPGTPITLVVSGGPGG